MIFNRFCLSIFFLISFQIVHAQVSSSQAWLSAGLNADLPHRWSAGFEYQARIIDDIKDFKGSYYSIDVQKGLTKSFSILAQYRLSSVLNGTFSRYSFGAMLDRKIGKIKTDLRVLYQMRMEEFVEAGMDPNNDNYLRFRLRGKYDLNKNWSVIASFEPIYKVKEVVSIDNVRQQIGFRYKIHKHLDINIFYLHRPDYSKSSLRRYNIFGIAAAYNFKPLKSKAAIKK